MRLVRVAGKFPGDAFDNVSGNAGDFFLPGRGVGNIVRVAFGARMGFFAETTVDPVVRGKKVIHGGDPCGGLLPPVVHQTQCAVGNLADQDVVLNIARMVFGVHSAKVRKTDLGCAVHALDQGEGQFTFLVAARVARLQIPLAPGLALRLPAKTDRAMRQHHLAFTAEGHGFPLGVVTLPKLVGKIAGAQRAACCEHLAPVGQGAFFQAHQQGHVGEATAIVEKIGRRLFAEVEFAQDHMA